MLIIEKNNLYEYKININRKKLNKLRKDLKNKYYKIKKIEFYPDYGDYKEQALNKANGDKIISIDVIKKIVAFLLLYLVTFVMIM